MSEHSKERGARRGRFTGQEILEIFNDDTVLKLEAEQKEIKAQYEAAFEQLHAVTDVEEMERQEAVVDELRTKMRALDHAVREQAGRFTDIALRRNVV